LKAIATATRQAPSVMERTIALRRRVIRIHLQATSLLRGRQGQTGEDRGRAVFATGETPRLSNRQLLCRRLVRLARHFRKAHSGAGNAQLENL
jgi:hypothetical protein